MSMWSMISTEQDVASTRLTTVTPMKNRCHGLAYGRCVNQIYPAVRIETLKCPAQSDIYEESITL